MRPSAIEYLAFHWAPVSGCLHGPDVCPVVDDCWARSMATRFRRNYGPGFRPILHVSRLQEPLALRKPARIGVAFTGDMFGPQVYRHWQLQVLEVVRRCPQHTFVFLTKNGEGLKYLQWPDNCWVGVSITGALPEVDRRNLKALKQVEARVRWVSIEPLLAPVEPDLQGIQWVVVGAQTGAHPRDPASPWVGSILEEAGKRNIPVWLKRNLPEAWQGENLIQELPHA